MEEYKTLKHLLQFFNPDWGIDHERSMEMLDRQMQVSLYVNDLRNEFVRSYNDEEFSWKALFAEIQLDEALGLNDEKAVREWTKTYIWPEAFPGEPPLIRD